ncbi:inactive serine protease 54 [Rhinatrema bivittatum]|uniref:inactive serine protease 54 n=1 Tax=Rhinatrema bivittatum TaxID=194408 RepID=UPI00112D61AE|nr:inactive serine protease 54 [Rhinatrema bivittatum]
MRRWLLLCLCISQASASCGIFNGSIPNNASKENMSLSGFPWLVSLQDLNGTHLVTGSIISKHWIVSIASSFQDRTKMLSALDQCPPKELCKPNRTCEIENTTYVIHLDFIISKILYFRCLSLNFFHSLLLNYHSTPPQRWTGVQWCRFPFSSIPCINFQCFLFYFRKQAVAVVGLTDPKAETEMEDQHYQYLIDTIIIHKDFDEFMMDHNIAILKTITAINFTDHVQPVCFPGRSVTAASLKNCQVSGRRHISEEISPAMSIWQNLSVVDIDPCPLRRTVAKECCSHRDVDNITGSVGEPGNPISCRDKNSGCWVLKGVLNHGGMKDFGPFLYTRTSYYRKWILTKTEAAGAPFYPTLNATEKAMSLVPENLKVKSLTKYEDEKQKEISSSIKALDAIYYDYYNGENPIGCGITFDYLLLLKAQSLLLLSLLLYW